MKRKVCIFFWGTILAQQSLAGELIQLPQTPEETPPAALNQAKNHNGAKIEGHGKKKNAQEEKGAPEKKGAKAENSAEKASLDGQSLTNAAHAQAPEMLYIFTDCKKPEAPALFDAQKKAISRTNYNKTVRQYNDHIAALNTYMSCLSAEAERDLQTYYQVVFEALESEQNAQLNQAEQIRGLLARKPISAPRRKPRSSP